MSEETQTAVTTTPLAAPESTANGGVPTVVGTLLTPIKQIRVYDDAEWEAFVLEWVAGLESKYELVERASGANDQGVDIVGFVSVDEGFAGAWDCYSVQALRERISA